MIIWDIVSLNTPIIMGRGNPREFKVTTFLPLQSKIVGVIFFYLFMCRPQAQAETHNKLQQLPRLSSQ